MTNLEIKAAVRARDGFRCTECGVTSLKYLAITGRSLDVHRIIPGSEYTVDGCVTLCRQCHGPKPRRPYRYKVTPGQRRLVAAFLKPELAAAFDAYVKEHNAVAYKVVARAIRQFLAREGHYKPN
jgi:5-methylcytosine-specific restriction endonuclease McrA